MRGRIRWSMIFVGVLALLHTYAWLAASCNAFLDFFLAVCLRQHYPRLISVVSVLNVYRLVDGCMCG